MGHGPARRRDWLYVLVVSVGRICWLYLLVVSG